jgi:hypothetical protein
LIVGRSAECRRSPEEQTLSVEDTMPDSPTNRGEPDRSRVSLQQPHEVSYWTKRFGVSREQLEQAVSAVGNSVEAIERHLRR